MGELGEGRFATAPESTARGQLVVPVPEAEGLVPDPVVRFLLWSGELDASLDRRLASFVGGRAAFDYELTTLSTFPDGNEYVPPTPALGFRRLGHHLHKRFREQTPLGDLGSSLVPHLAVPREPGPRQGLLERLPLQCHAAEVWLRDAEGAVLGRYAFGTSAA